MSQYERGAILPSDEVVLRMAEAAGQQIVCYWHLLNKSRVAGTVLPGIKKRPLPEAVLNLLVQVEDFRRPGLRISNGSPPTGRSPARTSPSPMPTRWSRSG